MNNIENLQNIAEVIQEKQTYEAIKTIRGDVRYDGSFKAFEEAVNSLGKDCNYYQEQNENSIVKFEISKGEDLSNQNEASFGYTIKIYSI